MTEGVDVAGFDPAARWVGKWRVKGPRFEELVATLRHRGSEVWCDRGSPGRTNSWGEVLAEGVTRNGVGNRGHGRLARRGDGRQRRPADVKIYAATTGLKAFGESLPEIETQAVDEHEAHVVASLDRLLPSGAGERSAALRPPGMARAASSSHGSTRWRTAAATMASCAPGEAASASHVAASACHPR